MSVHLQRDAEAVDSVQARTDGSTAVAVAEHHRSVDGEPALEVVLLKGNRPRNTTKYELAGKDSQ